MALTSKVLSSIQRAGQAVHDAQQLVNAALESQAARVAAAMSQKVAVSESEILFKDWKALTHNAAGRKSGSSAGWSLGVAARSSCCSRLFFISGKSCGST